MTPSKAVTAQIEQIKKDLNFEERDKILQAIQEDTLSRFVFKMGYLDKEWNTEEQAIINTKNMFEKTSQELEEVNQTTREVESTLENSKPPKFFGKDKYVQKQTQLKSQLNKEKERVTILHQKIQEYKEVLSKKQELLKRIEETQYNIGIQYSTDEKYFNETIQHLENCFYEKVFPPIPEELILSEDISSKINLIKEYFKIGAGEIYRKIKWKNANLFMYLVCNTINKIDVNELIIINGNQHKLHSLCADLLWQFINESGDIFEKDLYYWQIKAIAYLYRFQYDKELVDLEEERRILASSPDQVQYADFLLETVEKSKKLKNTLETISKSIQAGKKLALKQNNEDALNHYQKFGVLIKQFDSINFYSGYGLYENE